MLDSGKRAWLGTVWKECERFSGVSKLNRFNFFPMSFADDCKILFECCWYGCCCCCWWWCLDRRRTPLEAYLNVGEDGASWSRKDCCRLNDGGAGRDAGKIVVATGWELFRYFRLRRLWCERILLGSSSSSVVLFELIGLAADGWTRSSLEDEWFRDCAWTSFGWWWWWEWCWRWRRSGEERSVICVVLRYFCCCCWAIKDDEAPPVAKETSPALSLPLFWTNAGDRRRTWISPFSSYLKSEHIDKHLDRSMGNFRSTYHLLRRLSTKGVVKWALSLLWSNCIWDVLNDPTTVFLAARNQCRPQRMEISTYGRLCCWRFRRFCCRFWLRKTNASCLTQASVGKRSEAYKRNVS